MRSTGTYIQILAYGWLIDLSMALIGQNVRAATFKYFSFAVAIADRPQLQNVFEILHFCTGSLISEKTVLTAAHCLLHKNISEVEIVAGSMNVNRGTKFFPQSWITYFEWSTGQKQQNHSLHDVALIILEGEGVRNLNVTPAAILALDSERLNKKRIRIAGWGTTRSLAKPTALRVAGLNVISNEECRQQATLLQGRPFIVPPNYFCTKAYPWVVSTRGDDGAPICNRKKQIVGISIGVFPKLEGTLYTTEFLNQHLLNSNLNLHYYRDFLTAERR